MPPSTTPPADAWISESTKKCEGRAQLVAVAGAVVRVGSPVYDAELADSVVIVVADALDLMIDQAVDLLQLRPAFRVDRDKFFALLAGNTFCRLLRSEVGPAYGRAGISDDVANCCAAAALATSFAVVAVENGRPATKRKLAATRNEILERLATLAAGIDESRCPRTFF